MRSKFKDEHPFEKRKAEAERIRQKYADRIPVSIFSLAFISSQLVHRLRVARAGKQSAVSNQQTQRARGTLAG